MQGNVDACARLPVARKLVPKRIGCIAAILEWSDRDDLLVKTGKRILQHRIVIY